jgi:hypothetical protein
LTTTPAPIARFSLWTAVAIALAVAAVHAALGLVAATREGSLAQALPPDQCADLRSAVWMARALREEGLRGFFRLWVHHSEIHTPFVPAVSAVAMALFGETRAVGESVLPLFTFALVLGILRVVDTFYGRATALATALLTTSFPVFLDFSRTYLFEHPLAGMFALAIWTLVKCEYFSRTGFTMAFGVLAGLVSLTRGGAPIYVVGPVLAALAARGRALRIADLARLTIATAIAMALAATWYVPNWSDFSNYLHRVTYGSEAAVKAGGGPAFSWENATHYLTYNVIDGPGIPMLAVALGCVAWGKIAERQAIFSRGFLAAAALAWAIDYVLLLLGAQQEGARYFQPLMPVAALAVARAVAGVASSPMRGAAAAAVAALAAHQVVRLTILLPPGPAHNPYGTLGSGLPFYSRSTYHTRLLTGVYIGEDPNVDVKIPGVVEALAGLGLRDGATVVLFQVKHPFYHPNAISFEMARRGFHWNLTSGSDPHLTPREVIVREAAILLRRADAAVLRSGGPDEAGVRDYGAWILTALPPEASPPRDRCVPLTLGDGSTVRFLATR